MTPTEQDNLSIEEKVSVVLDVLIGHHLCPADENDQSCLLNISTKEISQLITADRKRVALEARLDEIERIDAANIDNGINFWFAHLKKQDSIENNNGWRTMRQYTPERIAELKAQQEEV